MDAMGLGVGALVAINGKPELVMEFIWNRGSQKAKEEAGWNGRNLPFVLKLSGTDRYGDGRYAPFPKHPTVSPESPVQLIAPAPRDSFARSVPTGWTEEEPPSVIMQAFDPDRW